jgi:hypothetical protein
MYSMHFTVLYTCCQLTIGKKSCLSGPSLLDIGCLEAKSCALGVSSRLLYTNDEGGGGVYPGGIVTVG